jgi:cyclic beta-1,2-glucan synthetase
MSKLLGRRAWQTSVRWDSSQIICAEIFGTERFRQHAHSLAKEQATTQIPPPVLSVIDRLSDNADELLRAYDDTLAAVAAGRSITPAAEWLIDNYHLVEQHVSQTRADLPHGFYRQLPKLATGPLAGHPRIFGITWAYVAHTDSRLDPKSLTDFINAYQEIEPLSIGELWAVAISLRLILIENLRRVAERIVRSRQSRDSADRFADQIAKTKNSSKSFADILLETGEPEVTEQFAVQLVQRLRDQNALAIQALEWLRSKIIAVEHSLDEIVSVEHRRQGAAHITIRNIITSLRLISDIIWDTWFDSVSLVDKLMRTNSNYGAMDFQSRTLYRTAIEELARGSDSNELGIAQRVLKMNGSDPGHYLIGAGRKELERAISFKPPMLGRFRQTMRLAGLHGYLAGVSVLAAAIMIANLFFVLETDSITPPFSIVIILLLLGIFPALEFGVAVMNFIVTKTLDASTLPGLALREGIPPHFRTMVVVPCLLTSYVDIEQLTDNLEIHYLSNTEGDVFYALLTDWVDADTQTLQQDEELLQMALANIAALNYRHGKERFFLLHRTRTWNALQEKWMGWERKRGKLHEFNRLLRGATNTNFISVSGKLPEAVRFVITLDADTRLPRDAVRRLVGKIAHPLNQPRFDTDKGRVVEGYAILQPRVTPSLPVSHLGSSFQRIYSSTRGIDPYAFAVSDVYQDLFGEGSFAGKGIYDIDAFEAALAGKVPNNSLLSHDLFEGTFARAALVTDVEVVEEYPERYAVAAARQHRWTRGDWQLLPWILGQYKTSMPALGLWKMYDNLRRSLTPIAILCSLFIVWMFASLVVALIWTAFVLTAALAPPFVMALSSAWPRQQKHSFFVALSRLSEELRNAMVLVSLNFAFLADQAGVMADAILRTVYRLTVSGRPLLEWTTAAQSNANHQTDIVTSLKAMSWSIICGLLAISVAAWRGGNFWIAVLPFALVWILAPIVACWVSKTRQIEDTLAASPVDKKNLRLVARRTWRFFERFVTAEDNMLPPDNYQETPNGIIAHRTSPTNIGLYLLSVASAREFGWIGLNECVARIEATLKSVEGLNKFRGHLFNWYDTRDLRPLEPKYVSSVDSGNLAAHLIALSDCCKKWSIISGNTIDLVEGIEDVVDILSEEMASIDTDRKMLRPLKTQFEKQVKTLRHSLHRALETPETVSIKLIDFALQASSIHATVLTFASSVNTPQSTELLNWAQTLRASIESHFNDSSGIDNALRQRLSTLAVETKDIAMAMNFGFLFDPLRQLLSIGYRVPESMLDESSYDMLASEARLASYFAIAKGDVRTRHWFKLSRSSTAVKGGPVLMSWSGSMFEYLMPSLVMRTPSDGLLEQTTRLVVARQIEYGKQLGIPWGISESAFNARDIQYTYQYSNFGVPGLGLKRGLADNTVIAPYATGLAAMVAPRAAAKNFELLKSQGGRGVFGFYEAIDYTSARIRKGEARAVVRAYFAHHQGMTIVALLNAIQNGKMRDRFHEEPIIRAAELLLQERVPRDAPVTHKQLATKADKQVRDEIAAVPMRVSTGVPSSPPQTHLLSNGQYCVMLTAAGSGQSSWNNIAITRWREDSVKDDYGSYIYIREMKLGTVWSVGHMPTAKIADTYRAAFHEEKAEFTRQDGQFLTTCECVVSPEDNSEVRRVTILNTALATREIEFTTYTELALTSQSTDIAHPAFSKLFVETEFIAATETLIATRRRRSSSDPEIWVGQFVVAQGDVLGPPEFETDRSKFIGIGKTTRMPAAMATNTRLTNSKGTVLDPIFAMRYRLKIPPGKQVTCTLWTVVSSSRDGVLDLVDRHRQTMAYDRAQTLAWTQAQIQLRHMSIYVQDSQLFQTLASHIIYASAALRPSANVVMQHMGSQCSLWPLGISGDLPILLARIDAAEDVDLVRNLLRAFEYLRAKGLLFDLVILNDRMSSYVQDLQTDIEGLVRNVPPLARSGQVFVVRADLAPPDTIRVLPAVARVVLWGKRGELSDQLARLKPIPSAVRKSIVALPNAKAAPVKTDHIEFFNGLGGFDSAGREYVVITSADKPTPAPWINVVANRAFGFHAAADGGGYTWFGNARDNQITVWSNDPVSNPPSEIFYVRDEDSGVVISPTLSPIRSRHGLHIARHGFGYTTYERDTDNLQMELTQCVPLSDTIKLMQLKLNNKSKSACTLSVTFYAEWVLGSSRAANAPYLTTWIDDAGAMLAQNRWKTDGHDEVVFADMKGLQSSWTGSRHEFLGPHGELAAPAALAQGHVLSNTTGACLDPCCALQCKVKLAAGQTTEVFVLMGAASNSAQAKALIEKYRDKAFSSTLDEVKAFWAKTLNSVQVKTPDRSFDIVINGWMLYQTLACRMWGRSGFYQASGAFGFRDQLQDSMALLYSCPELAREHILRAASRQFVEGDVQHWWLPNTGMGVRTRISDDTVWLVNCVCQYVKSTGDSAILDEIVPYIEGQSLVPGEHDVFFLPTQADERASLYEHCVRALDVRRELGDHGLPLIGTGDWNDGMNRVGENGKGESVWLGWFLLQTLREFMSIGQNKHNASRLLEWTDQSRLLLKALETHGWDGHWYRRAFFDDGSPLGSAVNEECRIDAIAQSWAVLSGEASVERTERAMDESYKQLVRTRDKLVLLFKPPFDLTESDPGYIKAYPPGIRENGGQYTHGVIWSIFAHAKLGQSERAYELFSIINPVNHALTLADAQTYKVEPYVIAADVYSMSPHSGRGGWTWYTGSAGWFFRAGLEAVLGVTREADRWRVKPAIPDTWDEVEISLMAGATRYQITVTRKNDLTVEYPAIVREVGLGEFLIDIKDDGLVHQITLFLSPVANAELRADEIAKPSHQSLA